MRIGSHLALVCLTSLGLASTTLAAKPGHGSVMSPAGAPLRVEIPLYELTASDADALKVTVAGAQAWAAAGLTAPAPLSTLSVRVEPGFTPGSRRLVLRSSQPVNVPIVDVLLDVTLANARLAVQSSYLVLVSASGQGSVLVVPGDTLSAIAQRYAVAGADLYQMLWGLYQANPSAFLSQNMNQLRAGATLSIPDAKTILTIDSKYAYGMFLKHAAAFKQGRGTAGRAIQTGTVATVSAQSESSMPPAVVAVPTPTPAPAPTVTPTVVPGPTESGSVKPPAPVAQPAPTGDQLRLSSAAPGTSEDDAKVAAAQELKEMQQRIELLQQNLQQLRDAVRTQTEPASTPQATQNTNSAAVGSVSRPNADAGQVDRPKGPETTQRPPATGLARVQQAANDNVLWVVLGASAVLALLMALMLRRAGTRENNGAYHATNNAEVSKAFDQKLQSLDLNLDSPASDTKPGPAVSGKV